MSYTQLYVYFPQWKQKEKMHRNLPSSTDKTTFMVAQSSTISIAVFFIFINCGFLEQKEREICWDENSQTPRLAFMYFCS